MNDPLGIAVKFRFLENITDLINFYPFLKSSENLWFFQGKWIISLNSA